MSLKAKKPISSGCILATNPLDPSQSRGIWNLRSTVYGTLLTSYRHEPSRVGERGFDPRDPPRLKQQLRGLIEQDGLGLAPSGDRGPPATGRSWRPTTPTPPAVKIETRKPTVSATVNGYAATIVARLVNRGRTRSPRKIWTR